MSLSNLPPFHTTNCSSIYFQQRPAKLVRYPIVYLGLFSIGAFTHFFIYSTNIFSDIHVPDPVEDAGNTAVSTKDKDFCLRGVCTLMVSD